MKNRYRLFRRGNGVYYALEPASQRQTSLRTRSHAEDRVVWDREWDQEKIGNVRAVQAQEKEDYYNHPNVPSKSTKRDQSKGKVSKKSLTQRLKKWLKGRQE